MLNFEDTTTALPVYFRGQLRVKINENECVSFLCGNELYTKIEKLSVTPNNPKQTHNMSFWAFSYWYHHRWYKLLQLYVLDNLDMCRLCFTETYLLCLIFFNVTLYRFYFACMIVLFCVSTRPNSTYFIFVPHHLSFSLDLCQSNRIWMYISLSILCVSYIER